MKCERQKTPRRPVRTENHVITLLNMPAVAFIVIDSVEKQSAACDWAAADQWESGVASRDGSQLIQTAVGRKRPGTMVM